MKVDPWAKAREMCERHGWDIREIEAGLERFRRINAPAKARALAAIATKSATSIEQPAKLAHFNSVKKFWSASHQRWTESGYIYIGRAMPNRHFNLPQSPFGNPFKIEEDTDELREDAIEMYAEWIIGQPQLLAQLENLRGMTLVCWCHPRRCHGEVLVQLLRERTAANATPKLQGQTNVAKVQASAAAQEGSHLGGIASMGGTSKPCELATEPEQQSSLQI